MNISSRSTSLRILGCVSSKILSWVLFVPGHEGDLTKYVDLNKELEKSCSGLISVNS